MPPLAAIGSLVLVLLHKVMVVPECDVIKRRLPLSATVHATCQCTNVVFVGKLQKIYLLANVSVLKIVEYGLDFVSVLIFSEVVFQSLKSFLHQVWREKGEAWNHAHGKCKLRILLVANLKANLSNLLLVVLTQVKMTGL